jgi:hypothetical protein
MLPVDASAGLNQFCTAGERDIFRGGLEQMLETAYREIGGRIAIMSDAVFRFSAPL